jgi:exodeoxyribonuclease VII small subunit
VRPRGCDLHHGLTNSVTSKNQLRDADTVASAARAFDHGAEAVYLAGAMTGNKVDNDSKPLDFEAAMRDLEQIVERLEHGDLPLEESLAAFERGVILTRSCQTALKAAEQKVEILLKKAGGAQVEEFDPESPKSPD